MSRRQVTTSPHPLDLSPAGVYSTSSDDCNKDIAKRGGVKKAPACKTAGNISSKENVKPSGELPIPTAMFGSSNYHVTHTPVNAIKAQVKPHAPNFLNGNPVSDINNAHCRSCHD